MTGERRFGLDLLRAAAVLTVVYGHGEPIVAHALPWYSRFSVDGVTLFFVLSGFLIGGILLKVVERPGFGIDAVRNFWSRRWYRTLPAYFATLALLAIVYRWRHGGWPDGLAAYALFAQNLAWPHPAFFAEAWSLAVEEWFYLGLPLAVLGGLRLARAAPPARVTLAVIVGVLLAVTAWRWQLVLSGAISDVTGWDEQLRKQVVARLDSLMFGVLGAWLMRHRPALFFAAPRAALAAGLALLLADHLLQASLTYRLHATLSVMPAAVLLMLPWLQGLQVRPSAWVSAVTFVSLVSYSMYLLHASFVRDTLVFGLTRAFPKEQVPVVAMYGGYWVLTVLAAWAMYRWVEQPFMRLRERRAPERDAGGARFGAVARQD